MPAENYIHERMFTFSRLSGKETCWKVRVWIKKEGLYSDTTQIELDILNYCNTFPNYADSKFMVKCLADNFEEISAVEVTNDVGIGELIYLDWP